MSATCDHVQAFLVDETLARPEGLEGHLADCVACRDFKRAHTAALGLRGASPGLVVRPPIERIRRRAGIVAGLALMVTGGFGLLRLGASPVPLPDAPEVVAESPRLEGAPVLVVDEDAEWKALSTLSHTVTLASQNDPTREDITYRAFGSLPVWLAPQTNRPVRALGRAISPVVLTREY